MKETHFYQESHYEIFRMGADPPIAIARPLPKAKSLSPSLTDGFELWEPGIKNISLKRGFLVFIAMARLKRP